MSTPLLNSEDVAELYVKQILDTYSTKQLKMVTLPDILWKHAAPDFQREIQRRIADYDGHRGLASQAEKGSK